MLILEKIRKEAILRLEGTGNDSVRLDVDLLLGEALAIETLDILLEPTRLVTDQEAADFKTLVARRMTREPMAQILGRKEFRSLEFTVNRNCLIPRPDSETLIEAALSVIADRKEKLKILDLGTGSGCLLLALMWELPNSQGTGVDISDKALAVARHNAERFGFQDRCDFITSDWAEKLSPSARFDIILANPPYIAAEERAGLAPDVRDFEPELALFAGGGGLEEYYRLAEIIPHIMADHGHAFVEIGYKQGKQVVDIFASTKAENIRIVPDLAGRDRCLAIDFR